MDGRSWIYRDLPQSLWMMDYYNNIQGFINYAQSNPINISEEDLRCSCNRCKNKKFLGPDVVTMHLLYIKKKRFMKKYMCWYGHGEPYVSSRYYGRKDGWVNF